MSARERVVALARRATGCCSTALCVAVSWGCSSASTVAPPVAVNPAPPPADDGQTARGGIGGVEHAAALEQLRVAPLAVRDDKQRSIRILLPDAAHWTRVRFMYVPSLVGFRYGKEQHALVGAFVTRVDDSRDPRACMHSFETYVSPFIETFEVDVSRDTPRAFLWKESIVELETAYARIATVAVRDEYAAAFAAYPAWPQACLVIGVAVPAREDGERARAVRDRFARDILPHVEVLAVTEPRERY